MSERFYADEPITGSHVTLRHPEAHHITHVMRAKVGDQVTLFDGTNREFTARVAKLERTSVRVEIDGSSEVNREATTRVVLAVALPKADRARWLVEKAVELGVAEVVPLITTRSVAQPGDAAKRRLERAVIEASKQCGRNRLMRISAPRKFTDHVTNNESDAVRWLAHPSGAEIIISRDSILPHCAPSTVHVAIGPEGGFTEDEVAMAEERRWRVLNLGPRVLRVETAALAMASWLLLGR